MGELNIWPAAEAWRGPVRISEPWICWKCVEERSVPVFAPFGAFLLAYCEHHGFGGFGLIPADGSRFRWRTFGPCSPAEWVAEMNSQFESIASAQGFDIRDLVPGGRILDIQN